MPLRPDLEELIFDAAIPFEERALAVFRYQAKECGPYRRFCQALGVDIDSVDRMDDIPHMPISVFKEVDVCTVPTSEVPLRFRSSATGGTRSTHWVANPELYRRSLVEGFRLAYGDGPFQLWSYTPGYSDNPDSSLIWMIEALMQSELCGYAYRHHLNQPLDIQSVLSKSKSDAPIIMIGAAFGFLDLIDLGVHGALPANSIVMETGGMKTRRRERTRTDLHLELSQGFGLPVQQIHSEYGMAEILTQAYAKTEDGRRQTAERKELKVEELRGFGFRFPHWARLSHRSPISYPRSPISDPRSLISDLANLYSCSFLVSGDRYEVFPDGCFEVLGRVDATDYRGCNFLMERD
jgi:hypothetical protein